MQSLLLLYCRRVCVECIDVGGVSWWLAQIGKLLTLLYILFVLSLLYWDLHCVFILPRNIIFGVRDQFCIFRDKKRVILTPWREWCRVLLRLLMGERNANCHWSPSGNIATSPPIAGSFLIQRDKEVDISSRFSQLIKIENRVRQTAKGYWAPKAEKDHVSRQIF